MQDVIRFAVFEVDSQTGELRKHGIRLKLADQPFRVLIALLERPGELVTREELQQRIWPEEKFGDFEQRLNRTVSKLRDVLGDKASVPHFIETLPGRGYRFIYPVEQPGAEPPEQPRTTPSNHRLWWLAAVALLVGLASGATWLFARPRVTPLRWRKLTTDNLQKRPPVLSDGTRLYFLVTIGGESALAQVPLDGGQPARLPLTLPGPFAMLHDISADGQELLVSASGTFDRRTRAMPLWSLRVADGTARRLGEIQVLSACWEPGGDRIVYTVGPELWIAGANGAKPRRLLEAKGQFLDSVSWAPARDRIRFARRDPQSNAASAWEIGLDGRGLRALFPAWNESHTPVGWTPDGRIGLFGADGGIWGDPEPRVPLLRRPPKPVPLITDAPEFLLLARPRQPNLIHAVGVDRLAELQRFDAARKSWTPLLDGVSADAAEYSRDGRRIAYVTYPQHTLWVREADGSKPIQLTSEPFSVMFPRWSPDGRSIAFCAQEAPDKPLRLYIVDSNGGVVRRLLPAEQGQQGYATWSPDGTTLLYGVPAGSTDGTVFIRVLDIGSGKLSKLEGSDGLFAPRYSPDGRMICANRHGTRAGLMLYDAASKRWSEAPGGDAAWPAWMPDSRSVLFESADGLVRYFPATRRLERYAESGWADGNRYAHCVGITPEGAPMRTLNRDNRQVYELRFERK